MSTGVYRTDVATQVREDLLDIITNLSPTATPIFTGLEKVKAAASIHQWDNYSTARATSNSAQAEGFDVSFTDLVAPTRVTNYVQEIVAPFKVSQKMMDSNTIGGDPFAFYKADAMKAWKLKAEYSLIWGTGTSGASGSGWEMKGLKKAITTNYYSAASGASLTESAFNDVLELAYNDVDDEDFETYTSMYYKRQISAFTAGNTKNIDADDRRLVNSIDVYQSDAARNVKLFAHRDISKTDRMILIIAPTAFKVAMLHNPEVMDVANNGPYKGSYVYGSLTLEYRQEKAGIRAENFLAV
jgi:hypothetical protein